MQQTFVSALDSLEKRLYHLVISRLDGDRVTSGDYREGILRLVEKGIGGFILFGGQREVVGAFTRTIQSVSPIPLFIASDIERGVGQQISPCTPFPPQMAVAAALNGDRQEDALLLHHMLTAVAQEARDNGINMPLVPVLDVNQDPDNPIICTRAFSDSPDMVARYGLAYIRALQEQGLITSAKHFPGHGDTHTDSHLSLPVITKSRKQLLEQDLMPFIQSIRSGVRSIMIGHLNVPALDSRPATLSRKVITELLRNELGFEGLVLTDALDMRALKGIPDVPVECLTAGADILLHPADPDSTVRGLLSAINKNRLSEDLVEASLQRILDMKATLPENNDSDIDYEQHRRLSAKITEMSITRVKNGQGLLPFSEKSSVHLLFAGDPQFFASSPLKGYFNNVAAAVDATVMAGDTVVFCIFTSAAAWKGSSGIEDKERDRLTALLRKAKHSIVISFGSPYVLRHFTEADMLIAAYDTTEQAQKAVIKCLQGRLGFRGRIPVSLLRADG